ncbi:MAG TPA: hypothetical protein VJ736_09230, partial [Actinomycetota bacterium]|nr:hypothetical protein [Actinomycetota bacterium]
SLQTIEQRAERLASLMEIDASAILSWCIAFAGMNALELAGSEDPPSDELEALMMLAALANET